MLAFCLGMSMMTYADNTDLSTVANTIYIDSLTAMSSKTVTLSVKMKNEVKVEGLQFRLVLPEGLSVKTVPDTAVYLGVDRVDISSRYSLEKAIQDDGSLIVMIASLERKIFSGTDGEVCTVKVQVPLDIAPDSYPIYIRDIVLSDNQDIPVSYDTDEVERNITVYLYGDVNHDGTVGIGDIVAITNAMSINEELCDADVNDDGQAGIGDIVAITNIMAGKE